VEDAVKRGAVCVLTGTAISGLDVTQIIAKDVRSALARLSSRFFGEPSKGLVLTAVTGTNGKTTTTYLIESILREAGFNPAVIGTINYRYNSQTRRASHTTPEAVGLQSLLKEMLDAKVSHCVMEVSSHALKQKRVDGCWYRAGVFTNLTREHLDYHRTMEDYFDSKAMLFRELLPESSGTAIINKDDPYGEKLLGEVKTALSYSMRVIQPKRAAADIFPEDYSLAAKGTGARIRTPSGAFDVSSALVGDYNLSNILASVAAGIALGIEKDAISRGVAALKSVPGRLEPILSNKGKVGFRAYVDYAHTADALERVLNTVRMITDKRVITVFGCGGDRDRGKRPLMGEVCARLSDITIITSDNPRNEDPLSIIKEIEAGICSGVKRISPDDDSGCGYMVEPDRRLAIKKAVELARPGDALLVAGKGHEDYQIVGSARLSFDDRYELGKAMDEQRGSVN
ncbi:MAG: UDP-N-acetylmuramoyl-L-alanyl-D-glutamate--2,6-diaminopimelate ligase, partial [Deltaproteobacteria bacterium]|nr:UDP-N-acetylmuramoyl-L-alanyl-D-glutamate--2,6-diaminopimelate ligase [Deltaproteobacteria bacterium]